LGALTQDTWSRGRFTVVTLQDMIDRGADWVASEVHRVVGSGPAYLSFDLDVIDIAYAPAVADPAVNGMTTRELVGADIVCFCPPLDSPAHSATCATNCNRISLAVSAVICLGTVLRAVPG
jgi:arginase family enzyme